MEKQIFRLIILPEADEFIAELSDKAREKMFFNIRKVKGGIKDPELFKKLGDTDIWEFRTKWQGMEYRLLAFWDKDGETLVVATHGFSKKTPKTPKSEIEHARAIMKEYLNDKNK